MELPAVDLLAPSTLTTQYESSRPTVPGSHTEHSKPQPQRTTCVLPRACGQIPPLDDREFELGELSETARCQEAGADKLPLLSQPPVALVTCRNVFAARGLQIPLSLHSRSDLPARLLHSLLQ
eukprot:96929-Hanusia_phi.AAC.6